MSTHRLIIRSSLILPLKEVGSSQYRICCRCFRILNQRSCQSESSSLIYLGNSWSSMIHNMQINHLHKMCSIHFNGWSWSEYLRKHNFDGRREHCSIQVPPITSPCCFLLQKDYEPRFPGSSHCSGDWHIGHLSGSTLIHEREKRRGELGSDTAGNAAAITPGSMVATRKRTQVYLLPVTLAHSVTP